MRIEDLRRLYFSNKNVCCKCGCELEDNNGTLGSVFVLDFDGNFYCADCDKEFEEGDERIFEADLYPRTLVRLVCERNITNELFVYAGKDEIQNALVEARGYINEWLDDESFIDTLPENYFWCTCDEDFYIETLQSRFKVEFISEEAELTWEY